MKNKIKNLLRKDQDDDLQLPLTILHSADSENLSHLLMGGSNGIWTQGRKLTSCAKTTTVAVFKTDLDKPGGGYFYICGTFGDPIKEDPKDLDLGWPNPAIGDDRFAYKINMEFRVAVPRDIMYKHIKKCEDLSPVSNKTLGQTIGKCLIGFSALQKLVKEYGGLPMV